MRNLYYPNWQRKIILFLTSQCITLFGSTLVQMALVWYAAMETSQGIWVAAFSICSYLPQFILSFVGGVWADRYPRKILIIGADTPIAFATLVMVCAVPLITSKPALLAALLVMSAIRSLGADAGCNRCDPAARSKRTANAVQRDQCFHAGCS